MLLSATHIKIFVEWFFVMFFSVSEKESLVTSLQQEMQQLKELNQSQGKSYVSSRDNCGRVIILHVHSDS